MRPRSKNTGEGLSLLLDLPYYPSQLLALNEKFGNDNPVEVEIGCGKSKFLNARARLHPDINFLGIDQVRFAYQVLVRNTVMEESQLVIESIDGRVRCDDCGYTGPIGELKDEVFHIAIPTLVCPRCEAAVEVIGGREFLIRHIKVTG